MEGWTALCQREREREREVYSEMKEKCCDVCTYLALWGLRLAGHVAGIGRHDVLADSGVLSVVERPLGVPGRVPFKPWELLYVPRAFNIHKFCVLPTQCMCFAWISEQTTIISLYSINWLVFITDI
jgi:hypothetical protein